eukprot:SAG31_NODE_8490_length_1441_cov_5.464232_2_plen_85_part_00
MGTSDWVNSNDNDDCREALDDLSNTARDVSAKTCFPCAVLKWNELARDLYGSAFPHVLGTRVGPSESVSSFTINEWLAACGTQT